MSFSNMQEVFYCEYYVTVKSRLLLNKSGDNAMHFLMKLNCNINLTTTQVVILCRHAQWTCHLRASVLNFLSRVKIVASFGLVNCIQVYNAVITLHWTKRMRQNSEQNPFRNVQLLSMSPYFLCPAFVCFVKLIWGVCLNDRENHQPSENTAFLLWHITNHLFNFESCCGGEGGEKHRKKKATTQIRKEAEGQMGKECELREMTHFKATV